MTTWEPIESAPKDGTVFLAYWPSYAGIYCQRMSGIYATNWTGWGGGMWEAESIGRPIDSPTHWMPFPKPPEVRDGGA